MKRLILLFTLLPLFAISQQTYVPDDYFEQYLINQGYDNVLDDYVTTANINMVTSLNRENSPMYIWGIQDLTGIEDFTALTYLNLVNTQLASLDLSNNTALDTLYIIGNNSSTTPLTSIDLSNNTALSFLSISNTQLTSLDLSNNTALSFLGCMGNQLTSLDLPNTTTNTTLDTIYCNGNQLTTLDVSNCTSLKVLFAEGNFQLWNLDVSNCTSLTQLWLRHCMQLASLDVSDCSALALLWMYNNPQLACLNVQNGNNYNLEFGVDLTVSSTNLTCIQVDDSAYSATNWWWFSIYSTNCNYPASCFSTATITEQTNNINLYPNPTNNLITLDIEGYNGSVNVEVYDLQGRLLETTTNTIISMQEYANGIYVFKVAYGDRTQELKVVKE
jgi:hypothetical protein